MEKEKQYLIKLKQQDDEIAKLQSDINNIQSYRQGVDSRADNLKLAQ